MPPRRKSCPTCKEPAHNFESDGAIECVPPKNAYVFGEVEIDPEYRAELYADYPEYTAKQIVESWMGNNPDFPGEEEFFASESESGSGSASEESGSGSEESGSESEESESGSGSWLE